MRKRERNRERGRERDSERRGTLFHAATPVCTYRLYPHAGETFTLGLGGIPYTEVFGNCHGIVFQYYFFKNKVLFKLYFYF